MKNILIALLLWPGLCAAAGPYIELSEAMSGRKTVLFEGKAVGDGAPASAAWAVTASEANTPAYTELPGAEFSVKFSSEVKQPGDGFVVWVRARAGGAEQLMQARCGLGMDMQLGCFLWYTPGALRAQSFTEGPFTVYSAPGLKPAEAEQARAKIKRLMAVADAKLGLPGYPPFDLLLYNSGSPDGIAYSQFRGFIGGRSEFAFPIPVPGEGLAARAGELDHWVPHELGDHAVRLLSPRNGFAIRWLAEGTGDYLQAQYLAGGAPGVSLGRGEPARPADLLDGRWDPDHYACSARFVAGLAAHYPAALKELFKRLGAVPAEKRGEALARETLSAVIGKDVTPLLKACKAP